MDRKSGDWMSIWDDRLLEYVHKNGSGSPKEIEDTGRVHVSKSQTARRLKRLSEYGLLRHLGHGVYVMTDEGEAYLEGDLDAQTLSPEDGPGNQSSRSASA
jgi:Mn-dependent DtxR family transcriptional regulator